MGVASLGKARSQHPWRLVLRSRATPSSRGPAGIKDRLRGTMTLAERRPAPLLRAPAGLQTHKSAGARPGKHGSHSLAPPTNVAERWRLFQSPVKAWKDSSSFGGF